jgi:2TM domain
MSSTRAPKSAIHDDYKVLPQFKEAREMAEPAQVSSDDNDDERANARRLVRQKRIFYTIVGIYLSLSIMWFAIDALDDSSGYWFYWPMLGTGLRVVVTGIVLFGLGGFLGADWERRQVEKYVERQNDLDNARTSRKAL